jgi:hypothetical protein
MSGPCRNVIGFQSALAVESPAKIGPREIMIGPREIMQDYCAGFGLRKMIQ